MKNAWLVCALVCSSLAFAQSNLPQPPGARVIDITKKGYFNEPAIAVNPANPQQVVTAWQVNTSVAYSQDGGATWTTAKDTASTNFKISGDVAVVYDAKGAAVVAYLGFDKLGTENYWAHNATRNGLFTRRSADGGRTWDAQEHAVKENPTAPGIPFEDKPGIAADTTQSPYRGNIYIGWTEFSLTKTIILFSRSSDSGQTWSAPIEISSHEGLPRDDNGAVEGFSAAVASDGTLYAAWADANNIAFATSHDGGKTFTPSREIMEHPAPYFPIPGSSRGNGFPQLGIDPRTGLLFLSWSDYRNGDIDVFVSTSSDQGGTWSAPVRVSTNPIHDGTDQFFQWLAVDPVSGAANVIFYDRRNDPKNKKMTMTVARSTDGGKTFENYAWTNDGFEGGDQFIGDYTGIAAYGDKVFGAWSETRDPKNPKKHSTLVRVGVADFNK
jgi:Neuraminidase (sialidase)